MIFFSPLIPDMTNEEEQMLDEALIRTYGKFGITHDNDSVYADRNAVPPKMKTMPILGDLHEELQKNEMTKRIAVIVSRLLPARRSPSISRRMWTCPISILFSTCRS